MLTIVSTAGDRILTRSLPHHLVFFLFFFNDTATTEIYTLSLHDALPIWRVAAQGPASPAAGRAAHQSHFSQGGDRKSTRLNSSHANISYAVFCLKKKQPRYATV